MPEAKTVLSVCAHPDDAEFMCAGTMALLHRKGWQVHIAVVGRGDCGSAEHGPDEISRIRFAEGTRAAQLLDGHFHCLGADDVFIMYDRPTITKAVELIRRVKPTLVFAPSPSDYMVDHEVSSKITRTACFAAGMPNIPTPGAAPFEPVPHLYYLDALGGHDILGNPIVPDIMVDITSVIDLKEKMLCCHTSQRNWLLTHHGVDEYILSMKRFDHERGRRIGAEYGEGFRQHLGHAFPADNLLQAELADLVHTL